MSITVNFIGCGRLGMTIARLFQLHNVAKISSIYNTSINSSQRALQFIGQGFAVNTIDELAPADIYFITTPDHAIEHVCLKLVESPSLKAGSIVVHCSGSLSSDILQSSKIKNCNIASIHPIKSFANPTESVKSFDGTYCTIEGESRAVNQVSDLFTNIGAKIFSIPKHHKNLYHAAGVMANNYLVTLHYQAVECYKSSGIDEETANQIVTMMMNEALSNVQKFQHKNALTGPIQRGDTHTVIKHLDALQSGTVRTHIYAKLGLGTLPLTTHKAEITDHLEEILTI